jgi:membrane-associated HD superfamily phosphohydrolase
MKFKEYNKFNGLNDLNELFDKPYKHTQTSQKNIQTRYEFFEDDSKDVFEVIITKMDKYLDQTWKDGIVVVFQKNNSAEMSISNSPSQVFATVIDIVKNTLKDTPDIVFIEFSAENDERSRISLYKRMAETFRKKLKWSHVTKEQESSDVFFTIYKEK